MTQKILLQIPQLCDEDWAQMIPDSDGRYCTHCQKKVIDFTGWTDDRLYSFFAGRSEQVCGRLTDEQMSRPLMPPQEHSSRMYRLAFALGLAVVFTQSAPVHAMPKAPLKYQSASGILEGKLDEYEGDTTGLKGIVTDDMGKGVKDATVRLAQGDKVAYSCITDSLGAYSIANIAPGKYDIIIFCAGFNSVSKLHIDLPAQFARWDTLAAITQLSVLPQVFSGGGAVMAMPVDYSTGTGVSFYTVKGASKLKGKKKTIKHRSK